MGEVGVGDDGGYTPMSAPKLEAGAPSAEAFTAAPSKEKAYVDASELDALMAKINLGGEAKKSDRE